MTVPPRSAYYDSWRQSGVKSRRLCLFCWSYLLETDLPSLACGPAFNDMEEANRSMPPSDF
jgi:hypothetical protein